MRERDVLRDREREREIQSPCFVLEVVDIRQPVVQIEGLEPDDLLPILCKNLFNSKAIFMAILATFERII